MYNPRVRPNDYITTNSASGGGGLAVTITVTLPDTRINCDIAILRQVLCYLLRSNRSQNSSNRSQIAVKISIIAVKMPVIAVKIT